MKMDLEGKMGNVNQARPELFTVTTSLAKSADWQACKKIRLEALKEEPEAFGSSFTEEVGLPDARWKEETAGDRIFFALSKQGVNPVGVAGARKESEDVWEIFSVYVNFKFRGKGISKELLAKILDEIRRRGGEKVRLNVGIRQEEAMQLYLKLGFKVVDAQWERKPNGKMEMDYYIMELNFDAEELEDYN